MQAVGGGPAAGAGSELPPELCGFLMSGQVEQAAEDEGAVDFEFVLGERSAVRPFGDLRDVGGGVGLSTFIARAKNARCRGTRGSSSADGEADPEGEIAAAGDAAVPEVGASSLGPPLPPRTLVVDGVEPKPLVGRLCVLCDAEIAGLVSAGLLTYVAENGLMVSQSFECSARQ